MDWYSRLFSIWVTVQLEPLPTITGTRPSTTDGVLHHSGILLMAHRGVFAGGAQGQDAVGTGGDLPAPAALSAYRS